MGPPPLKAIGLAKLNVCCSELRRFKVNPACHPGRLALREVEV